MFYYYACFEFAVVAFSRYLVCHVCLSPDLVYGRKAVIVGRSRGFSNAMSQKLIQPQCATAFSVPLWPNLGRPNFFFLAAKTDNDFFPTIFI